ncbi:hypothetical protein Tco_0272256 [Tanacetum coccineum]
MIQHEPEDYPWDIPLVSVDVLRLILTDSKEYLKMVMEDDATEIGLDIANTLCFHLGGARRSMTWRQFILALGLHTAEEMAGDGFEAYWVGSGHLVGVRYNLSLLEEHGEGTAVNVPYLLAQYLFIHAEGRKRGTRLFGGHFVRRLTEHFELVMKEGHLGIGIVQLERLELMT